MKHKLRVSSIRDKKVLIAALFLLLLTLLAGSILYQKPSGGYWTGWYPLLIPEKVSGAAPLPELLEITGGKLVYHGNASYLYNSFDTMRSAALGQQEQGDALLSGDPRLDPFILGASAYYKQDIYSIFYLPADRSPLQYWRALREYRDTSWILPDLRWDFQVLIMAGILCFFLLIRSGSGFLPCLLMIFYTGALIFGGNQNVLIPGVVSVFLMSYYRKKGAFRFLPYAAYTFNGNSGTFNGYDQRYGFRRYPADYCCGDDDPRIISFGNNKILKAAPAGP